MTKRIFSAFAVVVFFAVLSGRLFAWDDAGHMIIADEAFRKLSPEFKAQAIEVLKSHPNYNEWVKAYHPNPTFDEATYVFMRSSTWPDEIRRSGSPYDHPEWHFIDYPLRPPSFTFEEDANPTNNVLFGVAQCQQTLSDTNADPVMRAVYLSYLIHLVGDMHQPLHCESLFNDVYPHGDRGGNDFFVKPYDQSVQGVRLHGIWDGLLGTALGPAEVVKAADKLQGDYPRLALPELREDTTPKSWSLESRKMAILYGYLDGRLRGGTNAESAPRLPGDYIEKARAVAERRGALAGYRLADEIENYLKLSGTVSLLPPNTVMMAPKLPADISTAQAAQYYDEDMVVTGKVVGVSVRNTIALLNLDQPYPETPLTAVVFDDNFGKFGDLQKYNGHTVRLSGNITEYHEKPEIILESPDQIKITDAKP